MKNDKGNLNILVFKNMYRGGEAAVGGEYRARGARLPIRPSVVPLDNPNHLVALARQPQLAILTGRLLTSRPLYIEFNMVIQTVQTIQLLLEKYYHKIQQKR
jgi:hypothetical protein